jgi:SNF2 family DNA or RNA helicase
MKVSPASPFQIIYSLFQHEYLGYLFESFVIQLDEKGRLSFAHQNISSKNASEFKSGLNEADYELIRLMDSMQQDVVVKHFHKKSIKPEDFFLKYYNKEKGDEVLQEEIDKYLERRRCKILPLLKGKMLFEMGNDGEPAWRQIEILDQKASVLFHFMRNEENTHYFPTIKYAGQKLDFQYKGAYIICNQPAWMVLENKLYSFENEVDGKKLKPFLNKKFIVVPQKIEETYYSKFIAPLVAAFDVHAKGFEIKTEELSPRPLLTFSELASSPPKVLTLFGSEDEHIEEPAEEGKLLFELCFAYGNHKFKADLLGNTSVTVEKANGSYIFHKIKRDVAEEKRILGYLKDSGLEFRNGKVSLPKTVAFSWLNKFREDLERLGFSINQNVKDNKKYFIGEASIKIEITENIDWFDINAIIKFGPYEIPFNQLRKMLQKKQTEILLPNGEIAIIPNSWLVEYSELFAFLEEGEKGFTLKKHHLALVQDLELGELAKVTMNRKLEKLKEFEKIEDQPLPVSFSGTLRPYQKAGYNWLHFLNKYNFGGCLADDMGLGKTVQTLAMLQYQKENGSLNASLLIMPTSLIYNWEMEAKKFCPQLKVFVYTGTNREKNAQQFENYDLVLTSYGIARLDIDILCDYYFNYVILDESQAIKNPKSNIARAVKKLNAKRRLILTGTPIENSTMDLWSQMSFINPGLLGSQTFFKNEFLLPIEKKKDEQKSLKLYSIIKPFILRRHKSQVATELPEKIENIQYSSMTTMQEEKYEEIKAYYRNQILDSIEKKGVNNSQFLLLKGLTILRQAANHPKMVDSSYVSDSGKMEDVIHMLNSAISKGHKLLIFSSFVKHLQILADYLKLNKIDYAYLDGTTKNRKEQVDRFQTDEKLRIFLISLKAGGVGLNLTKADYVFILDPWWNPAIEAQAIDRAHRIGQESKVFTYKFITKNTVEEKILALQQNKIKLASELITIEESFVKNLSKEDISSLFD